MAIQNLNIDDLFFQKIKNNPSTNFIISEDLDRQFSFVKAYINNILVPAINNLTNGEIAEAEDDNPVGKFLFNDNDGFVQWANIDSSLIPDNYLSWSTFEKGPVASILRANTDGVFSFLTPINANTILSTDAVDIKWGLIDENIIKAGFLVNNKITGNKYIKRTLKAEHLKPGTLTPNIPNLIARTSKIVDKAVTGPKILPGSLELGNFDISESFPFQRLYNLLKPTHFADSAITGKVIQDGVIDLNNFVNYRWDNSNIRNKEYFVLRNYLDWDLSPFKSGFGANQFDEFSQRGNAFFFYYRTALSTVNDPKNPISYYWPKRLLGEGQRTNQDIGRTTIIGEFQVPFQIPDIVIQYKYKYVTMGKLKNNTVTASNFAPSLQVDGPVRLNIKIFFTEIRDLKESTNFNKDIDENSGRTVIITGEDSRLTYIKLKNLNGFGSYNVTQGQFPDVFHSMALTEGMCMDSEYWFGGTLLRGNYRVFDDSNNNLKGLLRLKNIHLKPGTIGKRHFQLSELEKMKAAADAKFFG